MNLSDAVWKKSSRSDPNSNCVECADLGDGVAVRDSKIQDGPALVFDRGSWSAFVDGIKDGEFD